MPTAPPKPDRIDPLPVGIAIGCALSAPALGGLPLVLVFCFMVVGGGGSMPETAYFIAFWYAIVLFAPPSIGCVVGLILKRLRQWRDLRETMPLDWMPAAP